ncbi:UNVERIFIED_CONTAM: hypothetical protein K2H54_043740 [Gekko kuhli]
MKCMIVCKHLSNSIYPTAQLLYRWESLPLPMRGTKYSPVLPCRLSSPAAFPFFPRFLHLFTPSHMLKQRDREFKKKKNPQRLNSSCHHSCISHFCHMGKGSPSPVLG